VPSVRPGTVQRRTTAELVASAATLAPITCSCGHTAIRAGDYYPTRPYENRCLDCYREGERLRQEGYRGTGGAMTVDLTRAGHRRRKRPQGPRRTRRAGTRTGRISVGKPGYVYCIGEENRSMAVKVGFSDDATFRIGALQTGNPRKLVILGVIRGTRADERDLHARYIKDNILNEWFKPTRELLEEFDIDPEGVLA
jgi:hypothetical protein